MRSTRNWLHPADRRELDPPDPWEQEIDQHTARSLVPEGLRSFPYRPQRAQDIPRGALPVLREAVNIEDVHDVLVIPAQARPAGLGRNRRLVLTPASVLGFGTDGAALWVDTPGWPSVAAVIRAEQVAAVETVHILLFARLTISSATARLNIRYNAVADDQLRPLVLGLRRRVAETELAVPAGVEPGVDLPDKWERLVAGSVPRLFPEEPIAAVAGVLPTSRRAGLAHAAVALTPRELSILTDPIHADPSAAGPQYGVDAYHIPRARIESLHAEGVTLLVRANGADLPLSLGKDLASRAAEAFAGHLPAVPSH